MGFWLLVAGVGMGGGEAIVLSPVAGLQFSHPQDTLDFSAPSRRNDFSAEDN